MYILQIAFGTPAFDEAVQLRYEVLRRPLGLTYTVEQLSAEYDQLHLAAYSDAAVLIGYLNLTPQDAQIVKMRQVAVAPTWQRKGVGNALVKASEELSQQLGFARMVLHARETAVPFYNALGYNSVGAQFEEVGIPHFRMEKAL
ncbi:MAG: GNAT family N-acetyltransferase [Saprospiraceae bacterium]